MNLIASSVYRFVKVLWSTGYSITSVPRIKGGPSWLENEVAACRRCNGQRGHLTPAEWLDECERRGWAPATATVVAALVRLREAIGERGGQRRARPYIQSQLRRLAPELA